MSNQSTPEVTQEDRKAAEDMLNHAFRHVGVRALKDVSFRDIAEAFAHHRVARMPDELREAAQRVANSALRANPAAWVVEGAPMEALLDVLASTDMAGAGEGPRGSFACPICGQDTPHHHTPAVVDAYQNKGSRA